MRLLYQSFGQEEGMQAYRATLEGLLAAAVSPGTSMALGGLPKALLEGKGFASTQALDLPALLRAMAAAVDAGVEGIAIGNAFDPGLWEARELFDVPVLGWFETVALYGLRVGWRLGVLCSGSTGPARIEELCARYGIAGRVLRPRAVGVNVPQIMAGFTAAPAAQAIRAAATVAAESLAHEGAEVLMVASGALDVFLQAHDTRELAGLPVLPGAQILARELESAVALTRAGVPAVSRAGRFRLAPESVRRAARQGGESDG